MVKALVSLMGDLELLGKIRKGRNEPISNRQLKESARQMIFKQVKYKSTDKVYNNVQVWYINYGSSMANVCIKCKTYSKTVL